MSPTDFRLFWFYFFKHPQFNSLNLEYWYQKLMQSISRYEECFSNVILPVKESLLISYVSCSILLSSIPLDLITNLSYHIWGMVPEYCSQLILVTFIVISYILDCFLCKIDNGVIMFQKLYYNLHGTFFAEINFFARKKH